MRHPILKYLAVPSFLLVFAGTALAQVVPEVYGWKLVTSEQEEQEDPWKTGTPCDPGSQFPGSILLCAVADPDGTLLGVLASDSANGCSVTESHEGEGKFLESWTYRPKPGSEEPQHGSIAPYYRL